MGLNIKQKDELVEAIDGLKAAPPTGAATSANQVTGNNSLASIDSKTSSVLSQLQLLNFENISGNSIVRVYYGGIEAGNPSGQDNLKTETWLTGATPVIVKTFTYDASDNLLTITTA